jgi:hypothetical protein
MCPHSGICLNDCNSDCTYHPDYANRLDKILEKQDEEFNLVHWSDIHEYIDRYNFIY